jgi:glycerophosphoryl diester phosphodiesterase
MKIFGHRGASGTEPENTIRSFIKAETVGADMVELDVRKSRDGEIVVFHDHDLLRLFGDPRAIKDLDLSEIKRVSSEQGREIPTLTEVLQSVNIGLQIELKVHGIEQQVLNKIKSFPHKVLISSFFPEILKKVRSLDGNIELGLILGAKRFHMIALANYFAKKLNLTSIHPKISIVSLPVIALFKLSKRKINVWTVNSEKDYKKMKNLGVDGIFTDYPELIKQYEQSRSI